MAKVLETPEEFKLLLQAVSDFCEESKSMEFVTAVEEQCQAFRKARFLTLLEEKDGIVVAYLTGMMNTMPTFFVTQAYSKGGHTISSGIVGLLEQLLHDNFKKIEFVTTLPVRVFEGYGFKQKSAIMEKELLNVDRLSDQSTA